MRNNGDIFINLKKISITIFTVYMLTASLYIAVFESLLIQIIILCLILGILLINEIILKRRYILKKTDLLFLIAIFIALGSLHSSTMTTGEIAGPVILSLGILISLFIRGDIENYKYSIALVKWAGVFYAISVIISYLLPGLYNKLFLSQLRPIVAESILLSMQNGYYTGFTGQVAYTAGYILSAIGVLFCYWLINERKINIKAISIFLVLFLGILLTQKRAHLLFMLLSSFFVYIQYSRYNAEKIKKTLKGLLLFAIVPVFIFFISELTGFGKVLFLRIMETVQDFKAGEDITSNRTALFLHAWELFKQNPLYGIGWGNFSETVVGNVTVHTTMETHNIYLQLLSETGVIGTLLILLPFIVTYVYTIKISRLISIKRMNYPVKWKFAVLYSLYTQTFFFLYGLTGNPLYEPSFLMMYFLAVGLIYSFWDFNRKGLISQNRMS